MRAVGWRIMGWILTVLEKGWEGNMTCTREGLGRWGRGRDGDWEKAVGVGSFLRDVLLRFCCIRREFARLIVSEMAFSRNH